LGDNIVLRLTVVFSLQKEDCVDW